MSFNANVDNSVIDARNNATAGRIWSVTHKRRNASANLAGRVPTAASRAQTASSGSTANTPAPQASSGMDAIGPVPHAKTVREFLSNSVISHSRIADEVGRREKPFKIGASRG